ncbi:sugar-binding transcriptional regulator [Corynebacterium sp. TA-R-1]|uniref:Sugar-binding transcriptional regulator n=1 Tax=Corynebacterium stercoris TaxID=2943490 RepID=A0ABT1FYU3_9CORY|nr:sugar-binding transcriptional regulator [Corynebacterium stercoris]MCP1386934.1 sugar-binding transcriptional regulator [Corynebacterium stercoris]
MDQRDADALDAAKLYYREDLSQAEVAARMGLSRPTVAKLLQLARDREFVVIEIRDPREAGADLSAQLIDRFNLQGARVVYPPRNDDSFFGTEAAQAVLQEIGRTGARYLEEIVEDGMSIGIAWGKTLRSVAKHLRPTTTRAREVVQLKGGSSRSGVTTHNFDAIHQFCNAFNAPARMLPLPVIFDKVETKQIVEQDSYIAEVLQHGRETDLVVFTVGSAKKESLVMNLGYLSDDMVEELLGVAVGDACSRFFTHDGEIAAPRVNDLTVGISLDELRTRPRRLLVAGGLYKAEAIETALWMGLATDLVVDQPTAELVLELHAKRMAAQV